MIAAMEKVTLVVDAAGKNDLLNVLRDAGVMHLSAVRREKAHADEATLSARQRLARARQVLASVAAAGEAPERSALDAADRVLEIAFQAPELQNRLNLLLRQAEQLALWGELRHEDLHAAGYRLDFVRVPSAEIDDIRAVFVHDLGPLNRRENLVGVVSPPDRPPELPAAAAVLEPPPRDRPAILAEARRIDEQIKRHRDELAQLAHLLPAMRAAEDELRAHEQWTIAERGGLSTDELFAVEGWLPADRVQALQETLARCGVVAALRRRPPTDDESPPTLVRTPRWARPIEGMFQILGTVPGFREFDISGAFLIALPLFAAMLIADGGYGLVLLLPALLFYRKLAARAGPQLAQLIVIIGACALLWGIVISSFFGLGDADLIAAGGVWAQVGAVLAKLKLIEGSSADENVVRDIMRLSFLLGAIHMSLAQLWRAAKLWPHLRALAHVGWAIFLWGMLLIVNVLVLEDPPHPALPYLLIGGGALTILFTYPSKNPLKTIALGLANFPLEAMGTLSDTISYIRLMAVGLASTILATTFNDLAAQLAASATWLAGAPVLLFGHGLNIGLAMIAIFAHGVRLNMLEFSKCLGMSWSGTPYEPFSLDGAKGG